MMSKPVTTTVITEAHTYKTHDSGWGCAWQQCGPSYWVTAAYTVMSHRNFDTQRYFMQTFVENVWSM